MDYSALIHRWFDEVWNQRSEEAMQELLHPDCIVYGLGDAPVGWDGFRQGWQTFFETFPDMHVAVDDVISEGNKSAARLTGTGTHLGPGLGVPATGRSVVFQAQTMCEWREGKIVAGWNVIDMASIYRQVAAK